MKDLKREPLPPHLSMDEYLDFVEKSFRNRNIRSALRQKDLEERIEKRFSLTPVNLGMCATRVAREGV